MIDAIRAMLAGRELVDLDEALRDRALAAARPRRRGAGRAARARPRAADLGRERCRERDLVVAMICQRLIGAGLQALGDAALRADHARRELALGEVKEAELLAAMDWLLERQQRIEQALARRHLAGEGFMLYDLSSSYVEGRCCPLASLGYSRDGKRGSAADQLRADLLARGPPGRDLRARRIDTQDQQTLPGAVAAVRERFGIERRGRGRRPRHAHRGPRRRRSPTRGVGFVSALKSRPDPHAGRRRRSAAVAV